MEKEVRLRTANKTSKRMTDHREDVGEDSEGLRVVESGGSIKSSSRVVPRCDASVRCHHLGDRDPLPLASRNSSSEGISDDGVLGVLDVEHLKERRLNLLPEVLNRGSGESLSGRLTGESERKGLSNSKGGEMDVVCAGKEQGGQPMFSSRGCPDKRTNLQGCRQPLRGTSFSSRRPQHRRIELRRQGKEGEVSISR